MLDQKTRLVVVMPAYNAEKTLEKTYRDLPKAIIDEVILVDDGSHDKTVKIAQELGLTNAPGSASWWDASLQISGQPLFDIFGKHRFGLKSFGIPHRFSGFQTGRSGKDPFFAFFRRFCL